MNEIKIKDDFIKLDAALKYSGVIGTGGQAKMVIQEGLVLVNGEVCTMRGKKLHDGYIVKFEDFEFVVKK